MRRLFCLLAVITIQIELSISRPASQDSGNVNTRAARKIDDTHAEPKKKRKVLILDVDNCLYSESEIKETTGEGIEQQIIDRTHLFGEKELNLSKEECDEMYLTHGSTVEGIRQKLISDGHTKSRILKVLQNYYHHVYDGIDMSCLLPLKDSSFINTGYNHSLSRTRRKVIKDILRNMPHPIYFASNSPKQHVMKVLSALGLKNVPYERLLTPDTVNDMNDDEKLDFPTKFHPKEFFKSLLDEYDADELVLVDDSKNNLIKAEEIGIRGLRVNSAGGINLEEALAVFASHIDSKLLVGEGADDDAYEFSDVKYLESKNVVDKIAINPEVWAEISSRLFQNGSVETLRIIDVGAGLLSILDLVLLGGGGKDPWIKHMKEGAKLEYIAYESNVNLIDICVGKLNSLGFERIVGNDAKENENAFIKKSDGDIHNDVKVILRARDFTEDRLGKDERPHLIVGCCFADLFEPNELVSAITRFTNYFSYGGGIESNNIDEILVYFPITFSGITQFVPPKPFAVNGGDIIPSDTVAFQLYADSLINHHGHNLDPKGIVESMSDFGAIMIKSAPSVWHIDPTENVYLWNTMLYFFGNSAAPEILKRQWDYVGWIGRARKNQPTIRVMNEDLLFSLPATGTDSSICTNQEALVYKTQTQTTLIEEIEFQSPRKVGKKVRSPTKLGPNQVEVKSICSLISSGTELKIFKGQFDDAALDVNIKGMEDESMKYPLAYGYSLVGIVINCGEDVADAKDLIGKLVFTFSPHSTNAIVDRSGIQVVPDGVSPEDAIFLPSVETALSIVHDAHVREGENVAIYGQGLIGLLINAILSKQQMLSSNDQFGTLTVIDTISDRLAMASAMGATQALLPSDASTGGPYDVSIEVSGNFRALQSAIDLTRNGGRVIVGSWYGNGDITLKLGIDFHRSHKTIKTSQVSTIPAELSMLWSKDRRFSLTWELVKFLRPSCLITKRVSTRFLHH